MDMYLSLAAMSLSAILAMLGYRYWEIRRGAIGEHDIEEQYLYSRYVLSYTSKMLVHSGREHAIRLAKAVPEHPFVAGVRERISDHTFAKRIAHIIDAVKGRHAVLPAGNSVSHFLSHLVVHKRTAKSDPGDPAPTIVMTGTIVETGPSELIPSDLVELHPAAAFEEEVGSL